MANPGFENGVGPWTTTGAGFPVTSGNTPGLVHSGTMAYVLDDDGYAHTDTITERITIPASCHVATLAFWLHVDTSEDVGQGAVAYDRLSVTAGGGTVASFSNLDADGGWVRHVVDVSADVGKTVALRFSGTEDSSLATAFALDDVSVTVS